VGERELLRYRERWREARTKRERSEKYWRTVGNVLTAVLVTLALALVVSLAELVHRYHGPLSGTLGLLGRLLLYVLGWVAIAVVGWAIWRIGEVRSGRFYARFFR
jgi:polyferredoxin